QAKSLSTVPPRGQSPLGSPAVALGLTSIALMLTEKDDVTSGNRIVAPYADESVQGVAGVGLLDWLGQAYAAVAVEFVPAGIVKVTVPPPAKLALTDCDEVIVTEHVVVPEHAPPQPRKDAEVSVNCHHGAGPGSQFRHAQSVGGCHSRINRERASCVADHTIGIRYLDGECARRRRCTTHRSRRRVQGQTCRQGADNR